jgi:hypothetical protein
MQSMHRFNPRAYARRATHGLAQPCTGMHGHAQLRTNAQSRQTIIIVYDAYTELRY